MWTTHPATGSVITRQAIIDNTHKKCGITHSESEALRDINFTSNCFIFHSVIITYVKWNSQDMCYTQQHIRLVLKSSSNNTITLSKFQWPALLFPRAAQTSCPVKFLA
jgi:hypothetical protein